ncbi:MAG TPA: hypothetical protein VKT78_02620 [Fimbriimonadaceae bacterium]|nr:hypothetical protein [Fimbriimonadaceae bacterium]
MRILILERNLIWSSRLSNSARLLDHEATVATALPETLDYDVAIINLAYPDPPVEKLQAAGVKVVAHAGHKETEKLKLGKVAGCDLVVTNSELTHKMADVLARLA